MKNFGRIFTLAALCAVILGSCIKEQAYKLETARLDVMLTRGVEASQNQGDGISDAMVWVYKCTIGEDGKPSNVEETATGWRRQTNISTYQSITLHVELPICDGSQDYLLVAVLNTDAFGDMINPLDDTTYTLDANTTYSQLSTTVFNAESADFWKSYPRELEPERMPISNWKTFCITSDNTHPDKCYELELPVYRAVGKVQLMMNKTSDNFDVTVTGAKIVSSAMPQNGGVFTANYTTGTGANGEPTMQGLSDASVTKPDWLGTVSFAAGERAMNNTTNDVASFTAKTIEDTAISTGADTDTYTWIGSAFLYENKGELTNASEYDSVPTGTGDNEGGYYMEVSYTVNVNDETEDLTKYVALPPVVRNHDYQIKATVAQTVTGDLVINYYVTEWTEQTINVPSFD